MNFCNRISTTYFSTRAARARARRDTIIGIAGFLGCIAAGIVYCYAIWRIFKP